MYQIKVSLLHPLTGVEMIYFKRNVKKVKDPKTDIVLLMWKSLLKHAKDMRKRIKVIAGGRVLTEVFDFAGEYGKRPVFRVEVQHEKQEG